MDNRRTQSIKLDSCHGEKIAPYQTGRLQALSADNLVVLSEGRRRARWDAVIGFAPVTAGRFRIGQGVVQVPAATGR